MRNPYEVLGVSRNASEGEIKKAYRKIATKHHPDMGSDQDEGSVETFKEATAAYEILSDDKKRAEFDRFGSVSGRSNKPFTSSMDDFMSSFFGGRGMHRQRQGEHVVVFQNIDLIDVLNGGDVEIKYEVKNLCKTCEGTGGEEGQCKHCDGLGARVIHGQAMTVKTVCEVCGGKGKEVTKVCGDCQEGFSGSSERTVDFKIPQGVEDGMRFAMKGMGNPCFDGVNGNLFVVVNVNKHDIFERLPDGNLLCKIPVTYTQLVFGSSIEVPTLENKIDFKMPPGTKSGTKFRFKGHGLPIFNKRGGIYKGDQLAEVDLQVPQDLEDEHRSILENLAAIERGE